MVSLYGDSARFTIVCFGIPTCSHCQETIPVLDSMYRAKWKAAGVKMYAIAKETSGTKRTGWSFINDHHLGD
jgi:hypothetical protein